METLIYSNIHNVDAGLLGIFSTSWILKNKGTSIVSIELIEDMVIKFRVFDTWSGTVSSRPKLLTKGMYYVGDPCYIFNETWDSILSTTDYFKKIPKNCIRLNTGGDGAFKVEIIEVG